MKFKRILAAVTTYLMVATMMLQPFAVWAEGVQQKAAQEQSATENVSSDDSATTTIPLDDESESSDNAAVGDADVSSGAAASSADDAAATSENVAASVASSAQLVADTDAVEFLYIDLPTVNEGCEQNVAVSLNDVFGTIKSAVLELKSGDTVKTVEAAASDGNAFLYTMSDLTAGTWTVSAVDVESDQGSRRVEFTTVENNEFTVEQGESSEVSAEDGTAVTAYTLDESGELAEADSIGDAIETAEKTTDEAADTTSSKKSSSVTGMIGSSVLGLASKFFKSIKADTARSGGTLTIAINPGHGGGDTGATGINGSHEADLNWKIANYLKTELQTYRDVNVVLTRDTKDGVYSSDMATELKARAQRAADLGADVYVSIHLNSTGNGGAKGAEVWVPNNRSYNNYTHTVGKSLGKKILAQLTALGLGDRGVKTRSYDNGSIYSADADGCGQAQDYYGDIRYARAHGIPGIIVEHCFIDNADDYNRYLSSEAKLKQLAVADANGIAEQYDLKRNGTYVSAQAHVQDYGWMAYSTTQAGTVGESKRVEALRLKFESDKCTGGVSAEAYVQNKGWTGYQTQGNIVGTQGQSLRLEAIRIKLTGDAASKFDVYYRVHAQNFGWMGWAKNGENAGTADYAYRLEAVQIKVVAKNSAAPGSTTGAFKQAVQGVTYKAHVQDIGWQAAVEDGETAGTTGRSKRIEAINLGIQFQKDSGTIQGNAHVQDIGWQGWRTGTIGTSGQSKRVEAIQLKLTGTLASKYDIYYRVHAENFGWMAWAKNGASAGTQGYSYRLEAIQIKMVAKSGGSAPSTAGTAFRIAPESVQYAAHVQDIGWQASVTDGATAGTTGRSKRVEALTFSIKSQQTSGSIQGNAHVQDIGWQGWRSGSMGTSGKSKRLEAIQFKLTGDLATKYDIYYRVHAQNFGWMGWAKNGESAGSEGYSYRLEAIQVKLVSKNGSAPGSTANAFQQKVTATASGEKIMGSSKYSAAQMVKLYKSVGKSYPTSTYKAKGATTIEDFCTILVDEAKAEGVRAEVVFAQSMIETGWLQFGGSVKASQCNFAGLGATSATTGGATFADVRTGLRAQVQHLKAYATTDKLKNACVDPRFNLVKRGCAPLITDLNGKWAVPGTTYGQNIIATMNKLANF